MHGWLWILWLAGLDFASRLRSGDAGIRKCTIVANFGLNFASRMGSGDAGFRKCTTVANVGLYFTSRLRSGDAGFRKCTTVANFGLDFSVTLAFWRCGRSNVYSCFRLWFEFCVPFVLAMRAFESVQLSQTLV